MFRPYQRIVAIYPDTELTCFQVPARLRQKTQDHPVSFGTGRLYHLSTEDDRRLSKERVFRHEFGLASGKVCQCPKPGERRCLVCPGDEAVVERLVTNV